MSKNWIAVIVVVIVAAAAVFLITRKGNLSAPGIPATGETTSSDITGSSSPTQFPGDLSQPLNKSKG